MSQSEIAKALSGVSNAINRLSKAIAKNPNISDKQIDDLFAVISNNAQTSCAAAKSAIQLTRLQNIDDDAMGAALSEMSVARPVEILTRAKEPEPEPAKPQASTNNAVAKLIQAQMSKQENNLSGLFSNLPNTASHDLSSDDLELSPEDENAIDQMEAYEEQGRTVLEVQTPSSPQDLSPEEREKLGERLGGRLVSSARNVLEVPGEPAHPVTQKRDTSAIDDIDLLDE